MALPTGWLAKGLGNILVSGVFGAIDGTIASQGVDPKDVTTKLSESGIDWSSASTYALSALGGIIGSPLGLLPAMMVLYQAGRGQEHTQMANQAFLHARIPPDVYAKLEHRGYINDDNRGQFTTDLRNQAWSQGRVDALMESYRVLLTAGEIRELYLRGKFGEGDAAKSEAIARLMQHGINKSDAEQLFSIFFYIPAAGDIVNWSAKEVFEPDMITKYGLDDEFEKLDLSLFAQAGVSPEIARNFWRAHWTHPGLNTVQELLHRTDFTEADMWEWFRLVEIPPFWRDKLIKIAYAPFTRVDVRRMYHEKILSLEEVFTSYKDIGYDNWHAQKLTDWTVKYYAPEDTGEDNEVRELTKAEILQGYEEYVISRDVALNGLISLDYSPETADFLLILRDVKIIRKETNDRIKFIGDAYKAGTYSEGDVINELGKLDLSGEQFDYYRAKFVVEKIAKIIIPTKADFKKWLKLKIISEPIFRDALATMGYTTEHIEYYYNEVNAKTKSEVLSGD